MPDTNSRMTVAVLFALAFTGYLMKLAALLVPARTTKTRWLFLLSPLLSPTSFARCRPLDEFPKVLRQTLVLISATSAYYWMCWRFVTVFDLHGLLLSYLTVPLVFLLSELFGACVALLWYRSGHLLPPLHNRPWLAKGVSDFWGKGKLLVGSMMAYFLLQAGGLLLERRFLRGNTKSRIFFVWLVVFIPAPLVVNEGFLRLLQLWR